MSALPRAPRGAFRDAPRGAPRAERMRAVTTHPTLFATASRPPRSARTRDMSSSSAKATRGAIRAPASSARCTVVEPAWPSPDGRTLVFVHGWPDSVDMWTPLVERLAKQGHRCVCVPLPWYPGGSDPAKRPDFNVAARDVVFAARQATKTRSPEIENGSSACVNKVTLVCHDWGCVVGFKVQKMVPDLVEAIVALDVGADARGLSAKEKAFVVAYQSWLAAAHFLGGDVGDYMTTRFARFAGAPVTKHETKTKTKTVVRAKMNWPYVAFWRDLMFPRRERAGTGNEAAPRAFRSSTPNERKTVKKNANDGNKIAADGNAPESFPFAPSCPVLFLFGGNKPARFHGDAWLAAIDAKKAEGDGSAWYEMNDAGHWFPVERVDETFDALDAWFRATKKKENDVETSDSPTPSEIRSAL